MRGMNNKVRIGLVLLIAMLLSSTVYATATLDVNVEIGQQFAQTGTLASVNRTCTYKLQARAAGNPMPDNPSVLLSGTTTANIGPIRFTTSGTYTYELRLERAPSGKFYTIDEQAYTLTYFTYQKDGELKAELTVINEDGYKVDRILYTHEYKGEVVPETSPPTELPPLPSTGERLPHTFWPVALLAVATLFCAVRIWRRHRHLI